MEGPPCRQRAVGGLPPPPPPTPLQAAHRRLACAQLQNDRLGADALLQEFDITELIGGRICGYDHAAEERKVELHGMTAMNARSQVMPAAEFSCWTHSWANRPAVHWHGGRSVAQAGGFELTGHSNDAYNGLYVAVDEHSGIPVLQNKDGASCHHAWLLATRQLAASTGGFDGSGLVTWNLLLVEALTPPFPHTH